ncbi:MAG: flavodoxin [Lachnospiraceae bacterium]|nr:flavodoxin [Lachnospiraceae bacterium]
MGKTLVVCFSASGITKNVAKVISKVVKGDLFEINPTTSYSAADLDWMNPKSRSSVEMGDVTSRPEISDRIDNLSEYDKIYLGFPIWWYVEPRIIDTFLEEYDFTNKVIIPFATSGGSDIKKAEDRMKKVCPACQWKSGKLLNGKVNKEIISSWIEGLN